MSKRIKKEMALELIQFVKKCDITGNVYHPNSTAAYGKLIYCNSPSLVHRYKYVVRQLFYIIIF